MANADISALYGIDTTQNNSITAAFNKANTGATLAQAAYDYANTIVSDTQIDPWARNQANAAFNQANTVSSNTIITQGVDATQNSNIALLQTYVTTANANISNLYGIQTTQNNSITAAFDKANTATANILNNQGIDATQNSNISLLQTYVTTANANISNLFGISTTQNNSITAAFAKANTAITTSGGTITGQLNVTFTTATAGNTAITISAANTAGGTGYADVFKLVNSSGGSTNPNKHIRISQSGALEIINNAYTARLLELTDAGDLNISGNVIGSGVKTGYSAARPGFRVTGSGTVNGLSINQNTYGALNSNNFAVDFNQGSFLNTVNGVFTAPVAGLYQIYIVGRNSGNASYSQLAVIKNATNGTGNSTGTSGGSVACMIEWAGSSTMNHTGAGTILKLAVGDTLALKVLAGTIDFDGNDNWSVAYLG